MRGFFIFLILLPFGVSAQDTGYAAFKQYPFTNELTASAGTNRIAWAMNEDGKRNVYVAEGPAYTPHMLTHFNSDDGQEISSLILSDDGQWVVFVRGGDHGANYDTGLPINPSGSATPFKMQVAIVPFAGGDVKYIGEGDNPVIAANNLVAFIKNGQVWTYDPSTGANAKNLFTARGNSGGLQWSPKGQELAFVSARTGHSMIGVFSMSDSSVHWVAPSFAIDQSPRWSPDGKQLAFVRRPLNAGEPDSLLVNRPQPWQICIAAPGDSKAVSIWTSAKSLRGSVPTTDGGTNLHWAAGNNIVFLSYQDGWPHLYSIPATGGKALLLTPGQFMCEHISISADKKHLFFSANTGNDPLDIDRRHAAMVSVDKADLRILTPGAGIEWTPVMPANDNTVAFISATAQRPPLPALVSLSDNSIQLLAADRIPASFPHNKLVTPKQVLFTSPDGLTIHGQLFEPPNSNGKHPAIVYIHGGPPRQMLLGWHYSDYYANAYACNQYLASLGFVVLSVNYRLGIGYGYEFHQPPHAGIKGAAEYTDIKAAGEWLRKQSFVDAGKIGVYGGSYGGYLTAMALAKDSKLFAAGVDIHGVHDWVGRSTLLTAFNNRYEKAPDLAAAVKTGWQSSPVSDISHWTSPVLIIHADDDRNVPFDQSIDLVSRLEKRKIPFESLLIADDTHHWMRFSNAVKVYAAAADYFVRKLK